MNSNDSMKAIAEGISIRGRLCIAIGGLLGLFFPGLVFTLIGKSIAEAYERLTIEEKRIVVSIFKDHG